MINDRDTLTLLLCELAGMGGAVHFHESTIYEEASAAIHGFVADQPDMKPETAMTLGEILGCIRHNNFEGATYELENLLNQMGE